MEFDVRTCDTSLCEVFEETGTVEETWDIGSVVKSSVSRC